MHKGILAFISILAGLVSSQAYAYGQDVGMCRWVFLRPLAQEFPKLKTDSRPELVEVYKSIEEDAFNISRGLNSYAAHFPELTQLLPEFKVWMDLGAGNALAMREMATSGYLQSHQSLYAFGLHIPNSALIATKMLERTGQFKYIQGKFEEQNLTSLPKADLITDVFGAVSYSPHLDRVIKNALEQLEVGGDFLISFTRDRFKIKTGFLKTTNLRGYLERVQGIDIVADYDTPTGTASLHIKRNRDELIVPELELIKVRDSIPPYWHYRLKN